MDELVERVYGFAPAVKTASCPERPNTARSKTVRPSFTVN